jgi:hypothetical protein
MRFSHQPVEQRVGKLSVCQFRMTRLPSLTKRCAAVRRPAVRTVAASAAASVAASIAADTSKLDPGASQTQPAATWQQVPLTEEHLQRNAALVEQLRGQLILAPLTRGNNLPFRRLCCDFGCRVTTSEMSFARHLLRGDMKERALLRRGPSERLYGVQIATNQIFEGVAAGKLAVEAGADWIDLNCGCPIYEATR